MGRVIISRRYYITAFVIICILFLAVSYRSPDFRKIIPLGAGFYANDHASPSVQGMAALQQKIENGEYVEQDDSSLISYLKTLILPPSTEPYNVTTTLKDTSMGQAAVVNKIFNEKRNGFFIECGALDGETRSNTYYFERYLDWTGLLIEGDPSNFKLLLNKHRKAHSINVCLSVKDTPMKVVFQQHFNIGKITKLTKKPVDSSGYVSVQCFPLYSILLALNRTEVDYFSLDVEGAELDVLKAIPFDKVNIKTLSVEYFHDAEGETGVQHFMESKGYVAHSKVNNAYNLANDIIFVKKEMMQGKL